MYASGFPLKENHRWCFFAFCRTFTTGVLQVKIHVVNGSTDLGFCNVPTMHMLEGLLRKKVFVARIKAPLAKAVGDPTLIICSLKKTKTQ